MTTIVFFVDKHWENSDKVLMKTVMFPLSADYTVIMMTLSIIFVKKVAKPNFLVKNAAKKPLS
jgi:hypothetical protein